MPAPSAPTALESAPARPGDLRVTLLIARRAALESLRDRTTLVMSAFFALALPILWVLLAIRPAAQQITHGQQGALGTLIAIYLLTVGLLPASAASGVASGQFAGEKEQGSLAPLLASPASNRAIFGGKVLGAVLPAILYSLIAEASYLIEVAVVVGPDKLRLLPGALSAAMLALVPAVALFAAVVASLISSRVRTFNAAQNMSGLVLLPIMFAFFALAAKMQDWGPLALFAGVAAILAADIALIVISAATWRREEVLAKR
jgi:ABC-2 type transport system permease protein